MSDGRPPIRTDSDGSTARADARAAAVAFLDMLEQRLARIEANQAQANRMLWEIGHRLFGKGSQRALPVATIAQAKEFGQQWAKVRELWKAFLNPDP